MAHQKTQRPRVSLKLTWNPWRDSKQLEGDCLDLIISRSDTGPASEFCFWILFLIEANFSEYLRSFWIEANLLEYFRLIIIIIIMANLRMLTQELQICLKGQPVKWVSGSKVAKRRKLWVQIPDGAFFFVRKINRSIAGSSPGRCSFFLLVKETQTKNDSGTAWTDWNTVQCWGANSGVWTGHLHHVDRPLSHSNKKLVAAWWASVLFL